MTSLKKGVVTLLVSVCAGWHASEGNAMPSSPTSPTAGLVVIQAKGTKVPQLKQIRKRIVRKQRVSFSDLRTLADSGDGLAAYLLAKRIMRMERPDLHSDAALYFSIAAHDGRSYAVRPLLNILANGSVKISERRLEILEQAVLKHARGGNVRSISTLAKFYEQGKPFGLKPELARKLMSRLDKKEFDAETALKLAAAIASRKPLMQTEIKEAEQYLAVAESSQEIGIRMAAQNLKRLLSSAAGRDDEL